MSQTHPRNRRPRGAAAIFAAGLITVGLGQPAAAHVTAAASTTDAGAHAVITLSVPHGCDGSATTSLAVQIPETITDVTPTRSPLYEVTTVSEDLPEPLDDGHGGVFTTRVAHVVFEAVTPLPDDLRDTFELAMALPKDAAGTTLYFPAVQTCESGESAWIEIPADGQDPHDLEFPAPAITVTSAGALGASESATSDSTTLGVVALAVATLALGVGVFGLLRRRS